MDIVTSFILLCCRELICVLIKVREGWWQGRSQFSAGEKRDFRDLWNSWVGVCRAIATGNNLHWFVAKFFEQAALFAFHLSRTSAYWSKGVGSRNINFQGVSFLKCRCPKYGIRKFCLNLIWVGETLIFYHCCSNILPIWGNLRILYNCGVRDFLSLWKCL